MANYIESISPRIAGAGISAAGAREIGSLLREQWIVIAKSGVAVPLTGTTSETTLATITIPAGAMGANGLIRVSSVWSYTNSANNKTLRARFGGTSIAATAYTTTASAPLGCLIANRNSASSQVVGLASGLFAATNTTPTTSSINTSNAADITLLGTLASAAETITLESYLVELSYGE